MVLFLCTGNYYRSRLAEELFNYYAKDKNLPERSFSKGLGDNWPSLVNPGSISVHTVNYLETLKIRPASADRMPAPCTQEDLHRASRIILLSEKEHVPMFRNKFPDFPLAQVEMWEVGDLPVTAPNLAMQFVHLNVSKLIEEMEANKEISAVS